MGCSGNLRFVFFETGHENIRSHWLLSQCDEDRTEGCVEWTFVEMMLSVTNWRDFLCNKSFENYVLSLEITLFSVPAYQSPCLANWCRFLWFVKSIVWQKNWLLFMQIFEMNFAVSNSVACWCWFGWLASLWLRIYWPVDLHHINWSKSGSQF